mmetsp:Transcript_26746/g.63192  ORF Transcript_26746/g.63192 Transcript_26746/m.63192 type:complete len:220 (+) Transcript_26746:2098-2757(+)
MSLHELLTSVCVHAYPGSTLHCSSQPSPTLVPPSSHPSSTVLYPSPHTSTQLVPFPYQPTLHAHENEPSELVQSAPGTWHECPSGYVAFRGHRHSFTSAHTSAAVTIGPRYPALQTHSVTLPDCAGLSALVGQARQLGVPAGAYVVGGHTDVTVPPGHSNPAVHTSQLVPLPTKPALHAHVKEPNASAQAAFASQSSNAVVHSSTLTHTPLTLVKPGMQ